MNLELCNLNYLWRNATTTEQANTISYYDQDYVCLLTDTPGAESLTLNLNNISNCIKTVGLLKINQPKNTNNILNVFLSSNINQINSIVAGPNTNTTVNGPHDLISINTLSSNIINLNGNIALSVFAMYAKNGGNLSSVSGIIRTLNNELGILNMNNTHLTQSDLSAYDLSINNSCSISDCNLLCRNNLLIETPNITNTICSGYNVTYNASQFTLPLIAYNKIEIDSNLINGGTLIGSGPNTWTEIINPSLVTALKLENIQSLSVVSNQSGTIRGTYEPIQSISIEGADNDKKQFRLASNFATNTARVKLTNFINYGTIISNDITLSNGTNYGTIRGRNINSDPNTVINNGIIESI